MKNGINMASSCVPGPVNIFKSERIDTGTMCLAASPVPGPIFQIDKINANSSSPTTRIAPKVIGTVYVVIWLAKGISVGHVEIIDTSGHTLLSQFPANKWWFDRWFIGSNHLKNNSDTFRSEDGRLPSAVYLVQISNYTAFESTAEQLRKRLKWDWYPGSSQTNCVNAAYDALKAGGIELGNERPFLPSDLNSTLDSISSLPIDDNEVKKTNIFIPLMHTEQGYSWLNNRI